ncbi:hypothetical protein GCM10010423_65010 [Streptomyces levis]|uniref:Uncharacterized protein n=1 Tax=Streptomyces levis TaxID=285566 RepID=A0ABN3P6K8_9ACTN
MGKRRIIIRRTRRPNLTVHKFPQHSHGAGREVEYSCAWCFFPKSRPDERCGKCARFGATQRKQSEISQVFLEPDPAKIPLKNG